MNALLVRQPSAEDQLKDLVAFLDQAVAKQTQRTAVRSDQDQRAQQELANAKSEIARLTHRLAESEKQLAEERMNCFLLRMQHQRSMELISISKGHGRAGLAAKPHASASPSSASKTQSPTENDSNSSCEYRDPTSTPSGCMERLLVTLQSFVFELSD